MLRIIIVNQHLLIIVWNKVTTKRSPTSRVTTKLVVGNPWVLHYHHHIVKEPRMIIIASSSFTTVFIIIITRPKPAELAGGIVGPGYSSRGCLLGCSQRLTLRLRRSAWILSNLEPWKNIKQKPTWIYEKTDLEPWKILKTHLEPWKTNLDS